MSTIDRTIIRQHRVPPDGGPPVLDPNSGLAQFWEKRVSDLATLPPNQFTPAEAERHRLYSLLLMALVYRFWNGNLHGEEGLYPWRVDQRRSDGLYQGGQYLGHNIGALAVDGNGEIIDFDFNHNDVFSSSLQHAEARLVRRLFGFAQIYDSWRMKRGDPPPVAKPYWATLSEVTVYTSLETCSMCAGLMLLGMVKSVVSLQHDPGASCVTKILKNLAAAPLRPTLPIDGTEFDFGYTADLWTRFQKFYSEVPTKFFWTDDVTTDKYPYITSFLCTDLAKEVFALAKEEFDSYSVQYKDFRPPSQTEPGSVLTNHQVQEHTRHFYQYADRSGQRGTPHPS